MKKAFTLIELLVVISVIGLLASIVLVNLKGTNEKGRIAKAKEFSSSISHVLGSEAVGIWRFEEGSGTIANDSSGYGNNGKLSNVTWQSASDCGLGFGGCLSFNGGFVDIPDSVSVSFKKSPFTIAAWVNFTQTADSKRIVGSYSGGSTNGYEFVNQAGAIAFYAINGGTVDIAQTSGRYNDGKWHYVVGTWDGTNMLIYVDGVRGGSGIDNRRDVDGTGDLVIGAALIPGACCFFSGLIDEVAIYNQGFTAYQIQQLYAQGLPKHQLTKK